MRSSFFLISALVFLASCSDGVISGEMESIPGNWDKNEPILFDFAPQDTTQTVDLFLTVRNNNDYKYNNLFLITSLQYPNGKNVIDTLEYRMARPDGTWLGTGIGSIKESKLLLKKGITFDESGTYTLRIGHAIRNNGEVAGVTNLEGITDVGYSLEKQAQ